jgi:NAD(P)-dependent dehydrogenase (short-subunit alcohol dehydrogenase family)
MTKSLNEKVAIVTGASRNLGRAFSEMLANEGASVVVHYNNPNKKSEADDAAAQVKEAGSRAVVEQADLTKTAEIRTLFDQTMKEFNQLDIMINTAQFSRSPSSQLLRMNMIICLRLMRKQHFFACKKLQKEWLTTDALLTWKHSLSEQQHLITQPMLEVKQHLKALLEH